MPRRGRSTQSASRMQASSTVPARMHPSNPPMPYAPQQQPSLFKQMAATAGGVAVGSAVGHTLGAALTGGTDAHSNSNAILSEQGASDPCNFELKQFLNCAEHQDDLMLCQGFRDALRQCHGYQG